MLSDERDIPSLAEALGLVGPSPYQVRHRSRQLDLLTVEIDLLHQQPAKDSLEELVLWAFRELRAQLQAIQRHPLGAIRSLDLALHRKLTEFCTWYLVYRHVPFLADRYWQELKRRPRRPHGRPKGAGKAWDTRREFELLVAPAVRTLHNQGKAISPRTVSRWLSHRHIQGISATTLRRRCEEYGVTLEKFLPPTQK